MSTRPQFAKQLSSVGEFKLGQPFGEGNYGIIRMGQRSGTDQPVVIKELDKYDPTVYEDIKREGDLMSKLKHENVITLYEQYETCDRIFLIMEYAKGGDLLDEIMGDANGGRLSESEAKRIFSQLVLAVEYMHANCIIHRDLKPDNIFLDDQKNVRVGDYGLSSTFNPKRKALMATAGTLHYSAPEALRQELVVGPELDIWSMGVILYVMLRGRYPFWGNSDRESAEAILFNDPKLNFPCFDHCQSLLAGILHKDPAKRFTITQIKRHQWCRGEILRQGRRTMATNLIKLHQFKACTDLTGVVPTGRTSATAPSSPNSSPRGRKPTRERQTGRRQNLLKLHQHKAYTDLRAAPGLSGNPS